MKDARVIAIRADKNVGRGSCSSIDECWSDAELIAALDGENITEPAAAVKFAYDMEGLHLEQGLNARWGEDDDPQLIAWKEWNEKTGGNNEN